MFSRPRQRPSVPSQSEIQLGSVKFQVKQGEIVREQVYIVIIYRKELLFISTKKCVNYETFITKRNILGKILYPRKQCLIAKNYIAVTLSVGHWSVG